METKYQSPSLEVICFDNMDIITSSDELPPVNGEGN